MSQPCVQLRSAEGKERAHEGSDVVDPVVAVEASDDGRTERSGRVDGCARPVGCTDVGNEDRDADADGGKMGAAMLLDGKEVDSQDELRCEEHLDKDTLGDACAIAESIGDKERAGDESFRDTRSGNGGNQLCRNDGNGIERWHGTDKNQTESHLEKSKRISIGVKHATANTVKDPDIDSEGSSEGSSNVHETEGLKSGRRVGGIVGNEGSLGTDEGEEQEHEGSAELSDDDDDGVFDAVWDGSSFSAVCDGFLSRQTRHV
ncbi:hypothetical protein HG530_004129 [Fusarium avenaceum]|nr:hypothetical protein HG530_004129 [Fusarium avenaceum]